jgi:hypothetical protein
MTQELIKVDLAHEGKILVVDNEGLNLSSIKPVAEEIEIIEQYSFSSNKIVGFKTTA